MGAVGRNWNQVRREGWLARVLHYHEETTLPGGSAVATGAMCEDDPRHETETWKCGELEL